MDRFKTRRGAESRRIAAHGTRSLLPMNSCGRCGARQTEIERNAVGKAIHLDRFEPLAMPMAEEVSPTLSMTA
jgi:hypothetical protein